MRRQGFTLIELLTVSTVLMVLMTLIVLGTGCAVLNDQRNQCGNHLKQLVLGLMNYHDTYASLPYGARNRTFPGVDGANYGSSWIVATLPYCEQASLFDSLSQADKADVASDYVSGALLQIASKQDVKYLRCPNSPLPKTQVLLGATLTVPSYAGVMGAKIASDTRFVVGPYGGVAASNGMLPANEALSISACVDGTANTIIVGEVSNWFYDDAGKKQDPALSLGNGTTGGWLAGTNRGMNERKEPLPLSGTLDPVPADQIYNLITVVYPTQTNNRDGAANQSTPNWGSSGVGRAGLNNPLLSAHGAAAFVVFTDGHIHLLSNQVAADVLHKLAVRDDGQAIPEF